MNKISLISIFNIELAKHHYSNGSPFVIVILDDRCLVIQELGWTPTVRHDNN